MRKLLLTFLLCVLGYTTGYAITRSVEVSSFKRGMDSNSVSHMLHPEAVRLLQNGIVNNDGSVSKRSGYINYNTNVCNDVYSPILELWSFTATDNTKYIVYRTTDTGAGYICAGSAQNFSVISGTVSATAPMYTVNTQGKIWFANGVDQVHTWDGVTYSTVTTAETFKYISEFQGRVVGANTPTKRSSFFLSGYNNGLDWTSGVTKDTSPVEWPIGGTNDGEEITCIFPTYKGQLYFAKRKKLYQFNGYGNATWSLKQLSNEVGCIEQDTVREFNGKLRWLSERGIEEFDGNSINLISYPVDNYLQGIVSGVVSEKSWLQDTGAHWNAGTLSNVSTTTYAGSVESKVVNLNVDLTTGTYVNCSTASGVLSIDYKNTDSGITEFPSIGAEVFTDTTTYWYSLAYDRISGIAGYGLYFYKSPQDYAPYLANATLSASITDGVNYSSATISMSDGMGGTFVLDTSALDKYIVLEVVSCIPNPIGPGNLCLNNTSNYFLRGSSTPFTIKYWDNGAGTTVHPAFDIVENSPSPIATALYTSNVIDIGSDVIPGSIVISSISTSTDNYVVYGIAESSDNISYSSFIPVTNGANIPASKRYIKFQVAFSIDDITPPTTSTQLLSISTVTLAYSTTGYFITQPHNIGENISAWSYYWVDETLSSSTTVPTINYYISTATAEGGLGSFTAISKNAIPSVSTATWVQYKFELIPSIATDTVRVNAMEQLWTEGTYAPKPYAMTYSVNADEYEYWLSFSSASNKNNRILVFDENAAPSVFTGINAASLLVHDRVFYAGTSDATGLVYRLKQGSTDAGNNIEFILRTGDLVLTSAQDFKHMRRSIIDLEPSVNASELTVGYYIDRGTTKYQLGPVLLNEDVSFITAEVPFKLDLPTDVRTIAMELSNTSPDAIRIYRYWLEFDARVRP